MSFAMNPDEAVLGPSRQQLREWFAHHGLRLHQWDVVLTELLVNAFNASEPGAGVDATISCAESVAPTGRAEERIICEISNCGTWAVAEDSGWSQGESVPLGFLVARRPADQFPNGRGLRIVAALTSGGEVMVTGNRTVVRVWREI